MKLSPVHCESKFRFHLRFCPEDSGNDRNPTELGFILLSFQMTKATDSMTSTFFLFQPRVKYRI